jgi:uncharacterized protein YutE (UPF0331/DUF86 family)
VNLNQELIKTRCQEIEDSLQRLEGVKEKPKEDFIKDQDLQDIACYRLLIAIEACLNLCYHVAARELKKVPGEYAECFIFLADAGIIDSDLSGRLQKMARFRNLLVHMYWKMNYEALYDILQNNLDDLRTFCKKITHLL